MSEVRPAPYVGVSGAATMEDFVAIVDTALEIDLLNDPHFVMVGVQATTKTQIQNIENSRGHLWHPVGDDLRDAAANEDSGLTRRYIHCFFEPGELQVGVDAVYKRTGHYANGMQLNMLPWHLDDMSREIGAIDEQRPHQDIVLQAHREAMQTLQPEELVQRLGNLPVDYVLLDASHGFGRTMDPAALRPYIDAVYQAQLPIGVVVAGGLQAGNLHQLVEPLLNDYSDLSCDAEGRLREGPEGRTWLGRGAMMNYLHTWRHMIDRVAE